MCGYRRLVVRVSKACSECQRLVVRVSKACSEGVKGL